MVRPRHRRFFKKHSRKSGTSLLCKKVTKSITGTGSVRILDFGCGWGAFLETAKLFGFDVYGVDADPDKREETKQRGIRVVQKLDELDPILKGKFHAISLFQVLEHLPNPLATLRELSDWVAPSGVLILETPDCINVTGINSMSDYRAIHPLSHINGFTPESLKKIAENAGFESVVPSVSHATLSTSTVTKTEIRRIVRKFRPLSTNQYFLKKA